MIRATPTPSIRRGTGDSAAKIIKNPNSLLKNTENVAFMRAWQINLHKNSTWKLMCIMCIIESLITINIIIHISGKNYPYYSHSFQKKTISGLIFLFMFRLLNLSLF